MVRRETMQQPHKPQALAARGDRNDRATCRKSLPRRPGEIYSFSLDILTELRYTGFSLAWSLRTGRLSWNVGGLP